MLTTLLTVALLHWVVLLTPGANVLLVAQLAAAGQRRSAVFAAWGITSVAVVWATLAILGVHAVFTAHPPLRLAVQLAGGLYLCHVALRIWRSAASANPTQHGALTALAAFRLGFLTNILNPKSALFFGSVFATTLPPQSGASMLLAAIVLVFLNALAWHLMLAFGFSRPGVQAAYARQRQRLSRIAGAVVGALGLRLLLAVLAEFRARSTAGTPG